MKSLTAAISLLALSTAFAASAEAQRSPYGQPLAPGENCAVRWYENEGSGELVAKTRARGAGRYQILITEGSDTLVSAGGSYSSGDWGEALLIRTLLTARNANGSRRTGRYSAFGPNGLRADLRVYDRRGRLICRDTTLDIRSFTSLFQTYQEPRRDRIPSRALTQRW